MSLSQLRDALQRLPRRPWKVSSPVPPPLPFFGKAVEDIKSGIDSGQWAKVVPVAFSIFQSSIGPAQLAWSLAHMLSLPSHLWLYGIWDDRAGLLGASPERLFVVDHPSLQTMALAGTRRVDSCQPPLQEDSKQLLEHQLVVDDLAQVLRSIADVTIEHRQVLRLPSLEHLLTPIHARLRELVPFQQIARRLHPTPALGASPRGAADAFLRQLDSVLPRGRFGAPFGWCDNAGKGGCLVAIRNVQWQDSQARIGAGCGIVGASQLQDEWAELLAKIRSVQDSLGI